MSSFYTRTHDRLGPSVSHRPFVLEILLRHFHCPLQLGVSPRLRVCTRRLKAELAARNLENSIPPVAGRATPVTSKALEKPGEKSGNLGHSSSLKPRSTRALQCTSVSMPLLFSKKTLLCCYSLQGHSPYSQKGPLVKQLDR